MGVRIVRNPARRSERRGARPRSGLQQEVQIGSSPQEVSAYQCICRSNMGGGYIDWRPHLPSFTPGRAAVFCALLLCALPSVGRPSHPLPSPCYQEAVRSNIFEDHLSPFHSRKMQSPHQHHAASAEQCGLRSQLGFPPDPPLGLGTPLPPDCLWQWQISCYSKRHTEVANRAIESHEVSKPDATDGTCKNSLVWVAEWSRPFLCGPRPIGQLVPTQGHGSKFICGEFLPLIEAAPTHSRTVHAAAAPTRHQFDWVTLISGRTGGSHRREIPLRQRGSRQHVQNLHRNFPTANVLTPPLRGQQTGHSTSGFPHPGCRPDSELRDPQPRDRIGTGDGN